MDVVKNQDYRTAYDAAASELESLLNDQERIEARIVGLRKTMNALATLISQHEGRESDFTEYAHARMRQLVDTTLTEDILRIVSSASGAMTTSDVREELKELGGSIAEHSNPLATINAVLNRLAEQGRVRETVKDGRKAWERDAAYKLGDGAKFPSLPMPTPPPDFKPTLGTPDPLNQRGKNVPRTAGEAKQMMEGFKPKK
jgi:hypothetical protein